jgi:hypothetical protein
VANPRRRRRDDDDDDDGNNGKRGVEGVEGSGCYDGDREPIANCTSRPLQ